MFIDLNAVYDLVGDDTFLKAFFIFYVGLAHSSDSLDYNSTFN